MWFEKAKRLINEADGEVGLLVKNLATGEVFAHNEEVKFPSASIIKVPIMVALLDAAAEGSLDLNSVSSVLASDYVGGSGIIQYLSDKIPFTLLDQAVLMIDLSDNTATNQLISVLGMDKINAKCREMGLKDTILGRKLMDLEARKQGKDNITSCRDMLVIFENLHNKPEKNALALKILKQQIYNNLLPLLTIPDEFEFAHKTGSLPGPGVGVRHDVGIMYLKVPVFTAFMTKNFKRDVDALRLGNEIGLLVYNEYRQ